MDVEKTTDVLVPLSGLSCYCSAAVVTETASSAAMAAVTTMTADASG